MNFFITLKKRHLAVILAFLIISFLIFGQFLTASSSKIDGSTNAARISYIKSLGEEPDDTNVSSKEITIPETFSKVYENYNKIQKKAGFDLSLHKGEKAVIYTYALSGSDKNLHLIVANGIIIGGDIAEIEFGGKMLPLI